MSRRSRQRRYSQVVTFVAALVTLLLLSFSASCATLLEFTGPRCSACQRMKPTIDRLRSRGVDVRTIDVSRDRSTASRYGVRTVPTFVAVEGSRELSRVVGVASESQLLSMLGPKSPQPAGPRRINGVLYSDRPAEVRVRLPSRPGRSGSAASGTVVGRGNRHGRPGCFVVTAAHVVDKRGNYLVVTTDGRSHSLEVLERDQRNDLAIGWAPIDVKPVEIGTVTVGQRAYLRAYHHGRHFVNRPTQLRRISGTSMSRWTDCGTSGTSGGGIFDEEGRILAVLSGSSDPRRVVRGGYTYACHNHVLRKLVDKWRERREERSVVDGGPDVDAGEGPDIVVPDVPPPSSAPPAVPPDNSGKLEKLIALIEKNQQSIAILAAKVSDAITAKPPPPQPGVTRAPTYVYVTSRLGCPECGGVTDAVEKARSAGLSIAIVEMGGTIPGFAEGQLVKGVPAIHEIGSGKSYVGATECLRFLHRISNQEKR